MGWKTVIIGCESKVSIAQNRMKITIGNEFQNLPLCDIDTVIFSHTKVVITIPLLSELVRNNIGVIICDERNDPIGIFQPFNGHSLVFKQLIKQINWKITRRKRLWKLIIEEKLQTEIDVLNIVHAEETIIQQIKEYRNSVYTDDQTNREAAGARLYFQGLFGDDFRRNNDDQINYALNYGYKIVASFISKCIAARGMLTQLGIHHIGESNPFNLTYDFIEPFRAVIDIWVYVHIKDCFTVQHRRSLVELLNYKVNIKVNIGKKTVRLCDGIEDIVDSYIAFLDERRDDILRLDLSKGIREAE